MLCTDLEIVTIEYFHQKKIDIFNIFAQNIDHGYMFELPRRGGSNKYQQSMVWTKNKKNRIPLYTQVFLYKSGVYIAWTCFPDGNCLANVVLISINNKPFYVVMIIIIFQ